MEASYLAMTLVAVAVAGACAGAWLRGPVAAWWRRREEERELRRLFEETSRQQQIERLNERRELYRAFRDASTGLVEELADGGGRWATFYLVRDTLRMINEKAVADVALAARQMCFVCQVMLNDGFSDKLSVRFDQALRRYEAACREDLASSVEAAPVDDHQQAAPASEAGEQESLAGRTESHRRYFNVLR